MLNSKGIFLQGKHFKKCDDKFRETILLVSFKYGKFY